MSLGKAMSSYNRTLRTIKSDVAKDSLIQDVGDTAIAIGKFIKPFEKKLSTYKLGAEAVVAL